MCRLFQVLCLASTLVVAGPLAALTPEVRFSGIAHDALFDVDITPDRALAVGLAGTVLESRDGGGVWTRLDGIPTPFALNGVAVQGDLALAVGQMGVILRQQADGQWVEVDSPTSERLMQVALHPSGRAVAVGAFGTLLRSTDAGASWSVAAPDWQSVTDQGFEPHLYAVDIAANGAVTVAGEFGLILRSANGRDDWTVLRSGEASIFGLHLREDGLGYAVGQSGTILKTTDGGQQWASVAEPGKVVWLNVRADGQGRVYVTGIREMASSGDGGRHWTRHTNNELGALWLAGLDQPEGADQAGVLAVGQGGFVLSITPD